MLAKGVVYIVLALAILLMPLRSFALDSSLFGGRWEGELQLEGRYFPVEPQSPTQFRAADGSVAYLQNYYQSSGKFTFELESFLRWDVQDDRRTHADVRKLLVSYAFDDWSVDVGVDRVFWGVTEFVHLVDVVNQTDFVEGLDDEQALGQPMVRVQWSTDWGTTALFVLPLFRERTFPGKTGRLHDGLTVDKTGARYRSGAEDQHLDYAVRWSNNIGPIDVGVAHFHGTSRDPLFLAEVATDLSPRLIPYYDIVDRTSLELQLTTESWLWKLEALYQSGDTTEHYASATGGFEYRFVGVFESLADIDVIIEYVYDDRGESAPTPFSNDWVIGSRLAFNDTSSTELLVGLVFGTDTDARFLTIEASRRLGPSLSFEFEARLNSGLNASSPVYSLRTEDFFLARLRWFF